MNRVVISLSVGTAFFLLGTVGLMCLVIAIAAIQLHEKTDPRTPYKPKTGVIGDVERQINDLKYGPVNLDAAKEVKNGLFANLRARRQARGCVPQSAPIQQYSVQRYNVQYCQPTNQQYTVQQSQPVVIDRTDCNYSYVVAAQPVVQVTSSVLPAPQTMLEYPVANPLDDKSDCGCGANPLEVEELLGKSPKSQVKTGSFICSNCRTSRVGDWHTDWREDGTPITFLCEKCYQEMTPQQRVQAYSAYAARQMKSVGKTGLLHQEIGK